MKKLCSLFLTFLKIGAFTFGGGYAMIALLENEFITRRHWMDQDEFLDMAAIAESTPGPVAVRINGRVLSSVVCDYLSDIAFLRSLSGTHTRQ